MKIGTCVCLWTFSPVPWIYISVFVLAVAVVQSLSCVWFFVTLWTAAHRASLSFTVSQRLFTLLSTESVMRSDHLIPCCPSPLRPLWASAILYCSFAVCSEVSEPDCSSSVFLSEDCFGFQGPLSFHTICKIKILWKTLLVIWWALHYSSRLPWIVQSFWQYWVLQRTLYISPFVCTIFDFFHQGLTDFWVQVICPLR